MKIICIGRNYVEHIHELGNELPDNMVVFLKPNSALHNNTKSWNIPDFSQDIHYECEVVLKISKQGKYITLSEADEHYDEITLGIDFTARDIQSKLKEKGLPWEKAKAFDGSAVVGNFVSKMDYSIDQLSFQLLKNDILVQDGNTSFMIYSFSSIIAEVSQYFTLEVGDLIFTGTPAGVGKIASKDCLRGILGKCTVFDINIQ